MMLKKIAVTGPECSGKTTLCRALAEEFNCLWVPEIARTVLEKDGPVYDARKVEAMARMQLEEENRLEKAAREAGHQWLFCDTNLLVYQVWTEVKFGHCPEWILEEINRADYHIQFLLRPDLPWEDDPLRENAGQLEMLFLRYQQIIKEKTDKWCLIEGKNRLEEAISIIEKNSKQLVGF